MFNEVDRVIFNEFLNSNTDVQTVENDFDYNSFYRAYVVAIDDPDHLGRIKIRIPMLQDKDTSVNELQWAYPACFTGLGNQVGQFMLPPVGSIVFVTFEYSDEHRPIYFGGIPTVYADGKSQSYGILVNNGQAKAVTMDDIPEEYSGSQAIVYKSPTGAILYFDSNDMNKKVVLKDDEGKGLLLINATDADTGDTAKFIKLRYDEDNYLQLADGEFHLVLDGIEVPIGGGGGTGDYTELVNKPKINNFTLNGNVGLSDIGVNDGILTFTKNNQTIGTFSANSSSDVTIEIPDATLSYLTKTEIDNIYNSL